MILDHFLTFTGGTTGIGNSDNLTDSPTTGAQASSQVIDLGLSSGIPSSANGGGARDIGVGDTPAMKILVQVTTAFVDGTNLIAAIQGAPDDGSGGVGSYTTMASGPTVVTASLIVGARVLEIDMPRPVGGQALPRFLRLLFTTTGTYTAGKVCGTLVLDRMDQPQQSNAVMGGYPAGINVAN